MPNNYGDVRSFAGNGLGIPPVGVPTADQEALQAPAIDPIFALAGGLQGGFKDVFSGIAGDAWRHALWTDLMKPTGVPEVDEFMKAKAMNALNPANDWGWSGLAGLFGKGFANTGSQSMFTQALANRALPNQPNARAIAGLPVE